MFRIRRCLPGLLLVLAAHASAAEDEDASPPAAPDFALPSLTGGNERLSEFRSEVVVLAFWSSRCGRCDAHVEELAQRVERHADTGARLVVVSIDREADASRRLQAELGTTVLHDAERSVARAYDLGPLPVTHLVDRHGRLRTTRREARRPEPERIERTLVALITEGGGGR